jgi:hypothetical protein
MKRVRNVLEPWGVHYVMYRMERCRNGRSYSHGLLVTKLERDEYRDMVARKVWQARAKLAAHIARIETKFGEKKHAQTF